MSRILVVGASHGIGLETVKTLLADGHQVRAMSRQASKIAIDHPNLEKIDGDATAPTDITHALDGVDAVVQTLGVAMGLDVMLRGTTLFSRATRILVDAMRAADIKRLIVVTGLGAGDSRGQFGLVYDGLMFPVFLKRIYDDKDIQEQIVKSSGLEWTIARPGVLVGEPVTGRYRALVDPREWQFKTVARADVARFLADEVRDGAFIGQTPLVIQ
ncbi:MAG: SDR family oxidoreductase [Hyphomicrobiaceae bacterium]|nr:SDR family oxidoreductase [Hyphomicrobiaceae bacterium]